MEIQILPAFVDNYIFLINSKTGSLTGVVDPGDANVVVSRLEKFGKNLGYILCTHHHDDHVGGVSRLKALYPDCRVYGHRRDRARLPHLDVELEDGELFTVDGVEFEVIATPGHTLGAICFHSRSSGIVFVGDTLFSLGCGRLFEGTAEQMYTSLALLKKLPEETKVYFAHEYTEANARFLLSLGKTSFKQKSFVESIQNKRLKGQATVPSALADEMACNPFLLASSASEFGRIRALKDRFR